MALLSNNVQAVGNRGATVGYHFWACGVAALGVSHVISQHSLAMQIIKYGVAMSCAR
ncbi:hypothetical protein PCAR4_290153 [Paraburkholderia caribensis]|nr:hypothetical protein PCAR4_290153 [Paraburkholderia caribensis]